MDRDTLTAGDEADDVVTGDRGAAAGELDQAVVQPLHKDPVHRLGVVLGLLLPALSGIVDLLDDVAVLGPGALDIIAQTVRHADRRDAAVSDGGKEIVFLVEGEFLHHGVEQVRIHGLVQTDTHVPEFILEHGTSAKDIFLPAFLLVPLLDLGTGRTALDEVQPVSAGTGGRLGSPDLNDVTVLQHRVIGDDPTVDLRSDHVVADIRVDAVGKVDRGGAGREVDDIPLGGEDENLVGEHVDLQVVDKVGGVGFLLALQQTADPGELVLVSVSQCAAAVAHLVFPVGRNAVFGGVVHLPGADLHLKGDAFGADDGGVDALVHVRLGGGDVILETARNGFEHVVDNTQDIIAVGNGVYDHAEGAEVEDAVERQLLGVHLPVDAVNVLDAAEDGSVDPFLLEADADLFLHAVHERFQFGHAPIQRLGDFFISLGVEILEGEIFQFPLGTLHAQPVRDGSVDLHGLQRLAALLFGRLVIHRAHVVHTVGDLDEDHADVLGHGQEHLAQVLHLLVFLAGVLYTGQLGDAFHNVGYRAAELTGDVFMRETGVLDHIVQESGDDAVFVKPHVCRNVRRSDTVCDVWAAVFALLAGVGSFCHFIGGADPVKIHRVYLLLKLFLQVGIHPVGIERRVVFQNVGLISHDNILIKRINSEAAKNSHDFGGVEIGFLFQLGIAAAVDAPGFAAKETGFGKDREAETEAFRRHLGRTQGKHTFQ